MIFATLGPPVDVNPILLLLSSRARPVKTRDGHNVWTTRFYSSSHRAWDVAAPEGTKAIAPHGGVVVDVGQMDSCGIGVAIERSGIFGHRRSRLCHLMGVVVSPGERVAKGQQVGLTGNTGTSTGPHVHTASCTGRNSCELVPYERSMAVSEVVGWVGLALAVAALAGIGYGVLRG